jgi:pectate lyase
MGSNSYNNIVDHTSLTWNQDEGIAGNSSARAVTLSWNLVAEGIRSTAQRHSTGELFAGGLPEKSAQMINIDIHHNLTMNSNHRNPLLRNKSSRVVNNLWYNHALYANHVSGGVQADIIGNKYKRGPLNPNAAWHEVGAFRGHSDLSAPGSPSLSEG